MNEKIASEILAAITSLREEMKAGFTEVNKSIDEVNKRLESIEADIAVLIEESYAHKKAIVQLKRSSGQ